MKVSLNWVREFTKADLTVDAMVAKIGAQIGAVEEVIDVGKKYQGIIVAKVVECVKHPGADKLQVCKIDDGRAAKRVDRDAKGYVQVICGAPNVREGLLVAWLPPGVTVPSSVDKEPFVLEAREIRGQVSNGMLASSHELAISDDHSGIVELDRGDAKPGADFAATYHLDDYVVDIENKMFTHRPDLFGILGVAREIAGIQGQPFTSPKWYVEFKKSELMPDPRSLKVTVKNDVPKLVPRFMALPLSIAHNGPSPFWLQTYLNRVGLRPINTAVDVTNYMMYLTGQPMHAYDADKLPLAGNLGARMSKKGDKLKLLNGKDLELNDDSTILITSGDTPVGVAGIMGGAGTETDEDTSNIILEVASFDMYTIRRSAMEYGLFTDASTRFTKGQSHLQNDRVLHKAVQLLRQFADAAVIGDVVDTGKSLPEPATVRVTPSFINDRLGLNLTVKRITDLLENVEFKVMSIGKQLAVKPPFWRTDIEIAEDIVEEVGRLYGYEKLPLDLPMRSIKPTKRNPEFDFKARIRDILSRNGANEVLTYSFVHGDLLATAGQDQDKAFKLSNALSPDLQYYRQTLIPSLLDKVHSNIKAGAPELAMFEMNKTHNKAHVEDGIPQEFNMLAFVAAAGDQAKKSGAAFYQARTYLDALAMDLGIALKYQPIKQASDFASMQPFNTARSALVHDSESGNLLGIVGEFKPNVIRELKLPQFSAGFEIGLEQLIAVVPSAPKYQPLPRFPKVEQDMTLKVGAQEAFQELDDAIAEATRVSMGEKKLEVTRGPLSIYQPEHDNHKNISYRFTVHAHDRTLTTNEVSELLDAIADEVHQKLGTERI